MFDWDHVKPSVYSNETAETLCVRLEPLCLFDQLYDYIVTVDYLLLIIPFDRGNLQNWIYSPTALNDQLNTGLLTDH